MDSGKGWEGDIAVLQSPWKILEEESQLVFSVHMDANPADMIVQLDVIKTSEVGFPDEVLKIIRPQRYSGWFT